MNLLILFGMIVFGAMVILVVLIFFPGLLNRNKGPIRRTQKNQDIILTVPGYGDGTVESCETLSPGLGLYMINFGGALYPKPEQKRFYDKQIKSPSLRQVICGNGKYQVVSMFNPTNETFIDYGEKNGKISEQRVKEDQDLRGKLEESRGEVERVRGEPLREFNRILESIERLGRTQGPGYPRTQ